jgi:hypothetical protein
VYIFAELASLMSAKKWTCAKLDCFRSISKMVLSRRSLASKLNVQFGYLPSAERGDPEI